MMGYGPEDTHFVVELTYNYGVDDYKLGNDFLGLTLISSTVLENAKKNEWPIVVEETTSYITAPGGYKFYVIDKPQPLDKGINLSIYIYIKMISNLYLKLQRKYIRLGFAQKPL